MADRIITVTDPSIVTNDTLDSYNNYTNQPSPDTPLGTMTIGEAAAGKTVVLTDGLVHEVTTKPVGTTNGEFSAVVSNAVTVDLSGGNTYALTFDEVAVQFAEVPAFTPSIGFSVKVRTPSVGALQATKWIFGNDTATNVDGCFGLYIGGSTKVKLAVKEDGGTLFLGANYDIVADDLLELQYSAANTFILKVNGTTVQTANMTSFTPVNAKGIFSALTDTGFQNLGFTMYDLDLDGETFDFSEQTGTTATGSLGTVMTLNAGTGSVTTMWDEIV